MHGKPADEILYTAHTNKLIHVVKHLVERTNGLSLIVGQVCLQDYVHVGVLECLLVHRLHKAVTLVFNSLVEHSACLASIAEVAVTPQVYLVEHSLDCRLYLIAEHKLARHRHIDEYLCEFLGSIVIKIDCLRETALQSGVRVDEVVHLTGVSRNNTDKLSPVVFQSLQQGVDGLRAKGVVIA